MTKKKRSIREPSFTAQIEASSRPIMKMMAVRVQTALTNHINQAVYQFFHPTGQPQPSPQAQPTQGFQRVGSASNAGWFNLRMIGNVLRGKLLGMYTRQDPLSPTSASNFFQVQIVQPCKVLIGVGEDARVELAKPGDVVNLNYGPKSKDLEKLIPKIQQGAEFEVVARIAGERIKLPGGRSMNNIEIFTKLIAPSTTPPAN